MKRTVLLGALLVLALLVSACGPAAVTQVPAQPTQSAATSLPAATEPAEATATAFPGCGGYEYRVGRRNAIYLYKRPPKLLCQ